MLVVVDYGMGNLASILNMLKKVGAPAVVSRDPEVVGRAERLILPGVGSFDAGMKSLAELGLVPVLTRVALEERRPVLGVCLGMQLFCRSSEEGSLAGLGWLDADVVRFKPTADAPALKVPHMGWNTVEPVREGLLGGLTPGTRFYFAHSYHVARHEAAVVLATATYGVAFPAAVAKGNLMGVQFHPEKSHRFGMALLASFAELPP